MKNYIIFAVSFILLFSILALSLELLSGIFLTSTYVPDLNEAWKTSVGLSQKIGIFRSSRPFLPTLLIALLAGTIAYLISRKFPRHGHSTD